MVTLLIYWSFYYTLQYILGMWKHPKCGRNRTAAFIFISHKNIILSYLINPPWTFGLTPQIPKHSHLSTWLTTLTPHVHHSASALFSLLNTSSYSFGTHVVSTHALLAKIFIPLPSWVTNHIWIVAFDNPLPNQGPSTRCYVCIRTSILLQSKSQMTTVGMEAGKSQYKKRRVAECLLLFL